MKVVRFNFTCYDDVEFLDYVIKQQDDIKKVYVDFLDSVKYALLDYLKGNECEDEDIIIMDELIESIDKHMLKKGWMRYEIVKQFNFDAHGDFDLTSQKFTPFSNCKDECVDVCNDLTKVLKDVLKEIKNEKF
jgi:hypothetical protein